MAIGERIAFYRRRRRLMQRVLANLIGLSEDWLSKIERGERDVRRLDRLADIARELRVSLSDLLGQPVLMEDDEDRRDDVPRVRDALMAPRRLSRVLYQAAPALENVNTARAAELVEFGWSDYQRGMLGRVVDTLPGLIKAAQQLEDADPASFSADRSCTPLLPPRCYTTVPRGTNQEARRGVSTVQVKLGCARGAVSARGRIARYRTHVRSLPGTTDRTVGRRELPQRWSVQGCCYVVAVARHTQRDHSLDL